VLEYSNTVDPRRLESTNFTDGYSDMDLANREYFQAELRFLICALYTRECRFVEHQPVVLQICKFNDRHLLILNLISSFATIAIENKARQRSTLFFFDRCVTARYGACSHFSCYLSHTPCAPVFSRSRTLRNIRRLLQTPVFDPDL